MDGDEAQDGKNSADLHADSHKKQTLYRGLMSKKQKANAKSKPYTGGCEQKAASRAARKLRARHAVYTYTNTRNQISRAQKH